MRLGAPSGDRSTCVRKPQGLRAKNVRFRPISCCAQQQGRLLRCGILCAHSIRRVSNDNVPSTGSRGPQPVKAVTAASSASSADSSESEGERIATFGVYVTIDLLEAILYCFAQVRRCSWCSIAFLLFFVFCHNVLSQYAPCGTNIRGRATALQTFKDDAALSLLSHNALQVADPVCERYVINNYRVKPLQLDAGGGPTENRTISTLRRFSMCVQAKRACRELTEITASECAHVCIYILQRMLEPNVYTFA